MLKRDISDIFHSKADRCMCVHSCIYTYVYMHLCKLYSFRKYIEECQMYYG